MAYVDGYVLLVKKKDLLEYTKLAKGAGKIWIKYGALQYVETVGDDHKSVEAWDGLSFPKMTKAKKDEVVIFAYITYRSRAHRDKVNAKVHGEMQNSSEKNKKTPFDLKKMAFAGFSTIANVKSKK